MERNAHGVLDAAFDGGVRYFDAARSYGRAEAFLASWLELRGLGPGEVTVGSKWGYTYTAGWRVDADPPEVKDLSAATLRRQLAESRALLGPHLRLYQIHSATLESGVLEDREVLDELERLRRNGLAIGVSVTGDRQAETIRRALEVEVFDTVQATWNLLERSAGATLAEAHDAGLGVIVKEALANGRLGPRAPAPELARVATELGSTPDAVSLAAVLAQPFVDVVLSGVATREALASNLAAATLQLPGEALAALAALEEDSEGYWSTRSALPWN
jgi:aryl-alcohol dehydrogenase-like predicted oxidoreductase